jgi:TP901 family phage tail tape measure protein
MILNSIMVSTTQCWKVTVGTNRNSVNMTDMAEAMSTAGSMASQTGVAVEQLSALIGTAVAKTKKEGSEIGTGLKSIFINLQNTQSNKIVNTFKALNISMTETVNGVKKLKTPIALIKELSSAYNSLPQGSVDKQNILTNIGGKHHANTLSAILSGYSDYEKMLQDYSDGTGSAAKEAEKSANNWEGSLIRLSNTWTKIVSNFANSEGITAGIKGLNDLLTVIDKLTSSLGGLGGIIGVGASTVGIVSFIKNLDWLKCRATNLA